MSLDKNPCVFFDVSVDGDPVERIVIEVIENSGTFFSYLLERIFEVCFSLMGWFDSTFFAMVQLFSSVVPKTAENFRALCTGILKLFINIIVFHFHSYLYNILVCC